MLKQNKKWYKNLESKTTKILQLYRETASFNAHLLVSLHVIFSC